LCYIPSPSHPLLLTDSNNIWLKTRSPFKALNFTNAIQKLAKCDEKTMNIVEIALLNQQNG
jgi:hypothetical protein